MNFERFPNSERALLYLFSSLLLKLGLMLQYSFTHSSNIYLFIYSPVCLAYDILITLIIFLTFDLPANALNRSLQIHGKRIHKHLLLNLHMISYFLIIFYTLIQYKIYTQFGSFLTYGMIIQMDNPLNFMSNLAYEINITTISLFITALLITLFIYKNIFSRFKQTMKSFFLATPSRFTAAILLFIIFVPAFFHLKYKPQLYGINKNPFFEFFSTLLLSSERHLTGSPRPDLSSITLSASNEDENLSRLINSHNRPKNVILYVLESTAYFYTALHNQEFANVTPGLVELSKNSMVMNNHYVTEPASIKALYALLMGKMPYASRNWKEFYQKAVKDITLADILKKHGYQTHYYFSGNGDIYYQNKIFQRSFDKVEDMNSFAKANVPFQKSNLNYDDMVLPFMLNKYLDHNITEVKPFFICINTVFPHHPYQTPEEKYRIYPADTPFHRYLNSLHYSDMVIKETYDVLKKHSIEKDTLFIIVSDHGEAFHQHAGNSLHSLYLYEENVHAVALIVNPTLFSHEYRRKGVSTHMDIIPTILNILQIEYPHEYFDGTSLFTKKTESIAPLYTSFATRYIGIKDGNYKFIFNYNDKIAELYDTSIDPYEKNNILEYDKSLLPLFQSRIHQIHNYIY